jgi:hypothetical protein
MWALDISENGPVKNNLSLGIISRMSTTESFAINPELVVDIYI